MSADAVKAELLALLDGAGADGALPPDALPGLERLADALAPHSRFPGGGDALLAGNWRTLFASFGAKHSAGRARAHDSTLAVQSFGKLPPAPIRVLDIRQEIAIESHVYSNVVPIAALDGARGAVIVHGRYERDGTNPIRLNVAFTCAELRAEDLPALLAALGLPAEMPAEVIFAAPRLHTEIVFLDETLRINRGSMGGLYVLERTAEPLVSVR